MSEREYAITMLVVGFIAALALALVAMNMVNMA